ncbi:hypothetical protein [Agrobacterium leguminum]|uniref:aromatic-ring hydroxylase C-terminal domain-containing protein n=1 Tax=Agrobacterium leguminum TaxID=2792015 RepID=UPI002FCE4295
MGLGLCYDLDAHHALVGRSAAGFAVLVRPDGIVAWVGEGVFGEAELIGAASCWLGEP